MVDENVGGAQPDESGTLDQSNENLTPPERDYKKDMLKYKDLWQESQERIASLETRFQDIEIEKAKSQGDKDKVIQSLQDELKKTKDLYRQSNYKTAKANTEAALKLQAKELNCTDPDLFVRLVGDERIGKITVDSSYRPDSDEIKDLIDEKMKEFEHIGLFKKDIKIVDKTPQNKPLNPIQQSKTLEQMSDEELRQMAYRIPGEKTIADLG